MKPFVRSFRLYALVAAAFAIIGCRTTPATPEEPAPEPAVQDPAPEPPADEQPSEPAAEEDEAEEAIEMYSLGDQGPAGGIIFHIDGHDEFDWTYLEAAPEGWHEGGEDPVSSWGEMGTAYGATEEAIGSGAANSTLIAAQSAESAAALALGANVNDHDDWFLPSLAELETMYQVLHREELGGFAGEGYWSSTERSEDRAMIQSFETGGQISGQKLHQRRVRPIRAL